MKRKIWFPLGMFMLFSIFATAGNGDNWKLYKEIDGVKIYYSYTACHIAKDDFHREYVLLRFVNTTQKAVTVSWRAQAWYDNKCRSCDSQSDEFNRTINLTAGQSLDGSCDISTDKTLKFFSKFLNYEDKRSELNKFELVNIVVKVN